MNLKGAENNLAKKDEPIGHKQTVHVVLKMHSSVLCDRLHEAHHYFALIFYEAELQLPRSDGDVEDTGVIEF